MTESHLSLDDALTHYVRYSPDLSHARLKNLRATLRRWAEFGGPSQADLITTGHYADFRRFEAEKKLSPVTIENHINCLRAILRHVGPRSESCPHGLGLIKEVPWVGKRLRHVPQPKPAVPLDDLSAVYRVAELSRRPCRKIHPTIFWRVYLVVAYHTGLRATDLITSLTWTNYDQANRRLIATANKTSKRHTFPVTPTLERHLALLPRPSASIFPYSRYMADDVRSELRRLCGLAGVTPFTPQSIRRRAATEYERAHPGSGSLLLGHILPSMTMTWSHYIDPCEVLTIAASKIALPTAFTPAVDSR